MKEVDRTNNIVNMPIIGAFTELFQWIPMHILIISPLFVCILYFIFQSSQQGAYVFLSLIISYVLCFPDSAIFFIVVIFASFFYFLQLDYLDLFHHIRAHFYHRIHMHEWSRRTYGKQRYQLLDIPFLFLLRFV